MPSRTSIALPNLPKTHYFVTVARGSRTRTYVLPSRAAHFAGGFLVLALLWSAVSTFYVGFHDDLTAALAAEEGQVQSAYESRLSEMRNALERANSRQLLTQSSFENRLRALLSREEELEARAATLSALVSNGAVAPLFAGSGPALGRRAAAAKAPASANPSGEVSIGSRTAVEPDASRSAAGSPSGATKPVPERAGEGWKASDASDPTTRIAAWPSMAGPAADAALARATESLDRIDIQQLNILSQLADKANEKASRLQTAISEVGLSPTRLMAPHRNPPAVGGPFVPLRFQGGASRFDRLAFELQEPLAAAQRLQTLLPFLPFRRPFVEGAVVTSGFGPRADPFTGRFALHTGIDFQMEFGAPVRAAAAGRVTIAGQDGGYGNLVEIDHGNGLSTRYGHLSAIAVEPGQRVEAGTIVGNVGATGRATGPHLHYETRVDGEPVDPARFLRAGERLFASE